MKVRNAKNHIFNHRVRTLAARLTAMQHAHHDIITATTLVHLDHDHSLESIMLRGPTGAVRAFAGMIRAERGVRNDLLNMIGSSPAIAIIGLTTIHMAGTST